MLKVCLYAYVGNNPLNATDPTGKWLVQAAGFAIGAGFQLATEIRNGSFENGNGLQAAGRVLVAGGAGLLGGGAGVAIAKNVVGNGLRQIGARAGQNALAGSAIGGGQSAANAAIEGRAPTASEVLTGAGSGAVLSAGGSVVGDGAAAVGRGIASLRTAGQEADNLANAMVDGAEAVNGVELSIPELVDPHWGSAGGAAIGEGVAAGIGNSGNLGGNEPEQTAASASRYHCAECPPR